MLSSRLRSERRRQDISCKAMAKLGFVNRKTQSAYEAGMLVPDANYLAGLAQASIDVQYILTGRPSKETLKEDEIQLIARYRRLNNTNSIASKKCVRQVINTEEL